MSLKNVSHSDPERASVSVTATAVAAMRALETELGEKALIRDPFARKLAGEDGIQWISALDEKTRNQMQTVVAARTKFIDDHIITTVSKGIKQVVIFGSGLDARAFRLSVLSSATCFEVDFSEVHAFKDQKLSEIGVTAIGKRVAVAANLSLPTWPQIMKESGFDDKQPTFWLLEGLTGYLKEQELRSFLTLIKKLSAAGSELLATFVGTKAIITTSMHAFLTDTGADLLKEYGWIASQVTIDSLVEKYGKMRNPEESLGYWVTWAHLPKTQSFL